MSNYLVQSLVIQKYQIKISKNSNTCKTKLAHDICSQQLKLLRIVRLNRFRKRNSKHVDDRTVDS